MVGISLPNCLVMPFKVRTEVLSKTLSHMSGKLNLLIFLFKVGLLTLINIDSLIFLARLWPSLPIIWTFCWVVGWPVLLLWWCRGEGSFRCSLNISPKDLEVSHMYSSWGHPTGTSIWPHFCGPWGLCPWGRPVGVWWCYYLWSGFVYHTSHRSF